jgi:hypothetical protein
VKKILFIMMLTACGTDENPNGGISGNPPTSAPPVITPPVVKETPPVVTPIPVVKETPKEVTPTVTPAPVVTTPKPVVTPPIVAPIVTPVVVTPAPPTPVVVIPPVPTKDYQVTFTWSQNKYWNMYSCAAVNETKTETFAIFKEDYDDLLLDKDCKVTGSKKLTCKITNNHYTSYGTCKAGPSNGYEYPTTSYDYYTKPDLSDWE